MTKDLNPYPMSPYRRELFLRVLNDEQDLHPITMRFHYLSDHFPDQKLDIALKWLVSNNLVGRRFVAWFKAVCSGSDLEMARVLLSVVDNTAVGRLIAGKNFKL
jgi:hypothetical protein